MEEGPPRILLISESRQESAHLSEAISEKGWAFEALSELGSADKDLNWGSFDAFVVDLVRDDGSGLDILKELGFKLACDTPIVAVASMSDKLMLMQALELGVTDFLWRGASALDVQARLATALKLGAMQDKLRAAQRVDTVTGTHNKEYMIELLEREFERSRRYKRPISCLLVDIDGFEELEENFDYTCTREILKVFSDAMVETLRNVDEVSRFRESIFLVLMPETSASNSVIGLARVREQLDTVQSNVAELLATKGGVESDFKLTVTAGIATYPDDGLSSYADLIMAAETALYEAKRKGPGETVRADFQ